MLMNQAYNIPPAQLWLGQAEELQEHVEAYLKDILCSNKACGSCTTCMKIRQHQHHAAAWIQPEKSYTVEQLNNIIELLSLELNDDEHYFIILQKTDTFTPSVANRLLKSIEEPPPGYHFILLCERRDAILPTIRSRCVLKTFFQTRPDNASSPLYFFFTTPKPDALEFLKELETSKINDLESIDLLDDILAHWLTLYKKACQKQSDMAAIEPTLSTLKKALEYPPMSGSSKIFLKNLFVQIYG